jgi:hypothetical protein
MAVIAPRRDLAHRHYQIRAGDAACILETRTPAPPDKGHGVLDQQRRSTEGASHLALALRFHQTVDRDAAEICATAFFAPTLERCNGLRKIDRRDAEVASE